ncbi:MAG: hypothetical protein QW331_02695, partial [Candidatus Woesearchaeota archaeon]
MRRESNYSLLVIILAFLVSLQPVFGANIVSGKIIDETTGGVIGATGFIQFTNSTGGISSTPVSAGFYSTSLLPDVYREIETLFSLSINLANVEIKNVSIFSDLLINFTTRRFNVSYTPVLTAKTGDTLNISIGATNDEAVVLGTVNISLELETLSDTTLDIDDAQTTIPASTTINVPRKVIVPFNISSGTYRLIGEAYRIGNFVTINNSPYIAEMNSENITQISIAAIPLNETPIIIPAITSADLIGNNSVNTTTTSANDLFGVYYREGATQLMFEMQLRNLSAAPPCLGTLPPGTSIFTWNILLDTIPGTGDANGIDKMLEVAADNEFFGNLKVKSWNGAGFVETNDTFQKSFICPENKIQFEVPKTAVNFNGMDGVSGFFKTERIGGSPVTEDFFFFDKSPPRNISLMIFDVEGILPGENLTEKCGSYEITWNIPNDNTGVAGYYLEEDKTFPFTFLDAITTLITPRFNNTIRFFFNETGTDNGRHEYRVKAFDSFNNNGTFSFPQFAIVNSNATLQQCPNCGAYDDVNNCIADERCGWDNSTNFCFNLLSGGVNFGEFLLYNGDFFDVSNSFIISPLDNQTSNSSKDFKFTAGGGNFYIDPNWDSNGTAQIQYISGATSLENVASCPTTGYGLTSLASKGSSANTGDIYCLITNENTYAKLEVMNANASELVFKYAHLPDGSNIFPMPPRIVVSGYLLNGSISGEAYTGNDANVCIENDHFFACVPVNTTTGFYEFKGIQANDYYELFVEFDTPFDNNNFSIVPFQDEYNLLEPIDGFFLSKNNVTANISIVPTIKIINVTLNKQVIEVPPINYSKLNSEDLAELTTLTVGDACKGLSGAELTGCQSEVTATINGVAQEQIKTINRFVRYSPGETIAAQVTVQSIVPLENYDLGLILGGGYFVNDENFIVNGTIVNISTTASIYNITLQVPDVMPPGYAELLAGFKKEREAIKAAGNKFNATDRKAAFFPLDILIIRAAQPPVIHSPLFGPTN